MNILFVVPRIPYPLNTGAKIRTFNLIKQAQNNTNKIIVLSFVYNEGDKIYVKKIENMGIDVITVNGDDKFNFFTVIKAFLKGLPVNIAKYNSKKMAYILKRIIVEKKVDIVHFDHIHLGQYVDCCNGVSTVIDEHNIESSIIKRMWGTKKNFFKKAIFKNQYKRMLTLEEKKCLKASLVLTVSREDKLNLLKICGDEVETEVIPNGVDTEYFRLQSHKATKIEEEDAIVFVGSMDWLPNSDGIKFFCSDILPVIWKKNPSVKFYIVGKNPPLWMQKLENNEKRIVVTGVVRDVRPYLLRAKVFTVPLRFGGGTRLKILEALAMEKAIVSTTLGAEGLEIENNKHLLIENDPFEFAKRVDELMRNALLRQRLAAKGREFVVNKYDWNIIGKKLNSSYENILEKDNAYICNR